jgi:hypothetical protein
MAIDMPGNSNYLDVTEFKAGTRLRSATCETQVVVVRAPSAPATIECGGEPMRAFDDESPRVPVSGEPGDGTQLGKRYVEEELGVELLCTKPGAGTLTVDGRPVTLKGAKPLPSSD